jgi:hypothetical protein
MAQLKIFLPVIFLILILGSCEKVIDVDLKESGKRIVIEATLSEGEQDFSVYISKTAPYFDNSMPEAIDSAIVTLTDDTNNSFNIPHDKDGLYRAEITGVANRTYTLKVEIEGEEYEASSFLPEKVKLDTVYSKYEKGFGPIESGYAVYFRYSDPALVPNYYRVVHYLNGEKQNSAEDMQVFNDRLTDGNSPEMPLIMKIFQPGDTVMVELVHFDAASYDYFLTLSEIIGEGGGPHGGLAAPGNPNTNWSGGILGYFSASASDTLSVVIQ